MLEVGRYSPVHSTDTSTFYPLAYRQFFLRTGTCHRLAVLYSALTRGGPTGVAWGGIKKAMLLIFTRRLYVNKGVLALIFFHFKQSNLGLKLDYIANIPCIHNLVIQ